MLFGQTNAQPFERVVKRCAKIFCGQVDTGRVFVVDTRHHVEKNCRVLGCFTQRAGLVEA